MGLFLPVLALGLVLAYAFGAMHGGLRILFGFVAIALLATAAAQGIRLWFTLRLGRAGKYLRAEEPGKFWTWTFFGGVMFGVFAAAGIFLVAIALNPTAFGAS